MWWRLKTCGGMIIVAHEIPPCRPRGVGPHDRIQAILVKIDRRGHFVLASGVVTLCRAVVVHRGSFFASCHDPFNQPWSTTGFTEWANLDANGAAVCFYKIGNALIEVDVPFLFTAHELFFREKLHPRGNRLHNVGNGGKHHRRRCRLDRPW